MYKKLGMLFFIRHVNLLFMFVSSDPIKRATEQLILMGVFI